jgi:hypothetical protein
MAEESDEWPNALQRIDKTLTQFFDAAESLRFDANAGLLNVSDEFRQHLLYVTSVVLDHDPWDPDWRRNIELRPRREPPLIRLNDPPGLAFGAVTENSRP